MSIASTSTDYPFHPSGTFNPEANLSDLPYEMLIEIFKSMPTSERVRTLNNLAQTNKRFHAFAINARSCFSTIEVKELMSNPSPFLVFLKKLNADPLKVLYILKRYLPCVKPSNIYPPIQRKCGIPMSRQENQYLIAINELISPFPTHSNAPLFGQGEQTIHRYRAELRNYRQLIPRGVPKQTVEFIKQFDIDFRLNSAYSREGMYTALTCGFDQWIRSKMKEGYQVQYEEIDFLLEKNELSLLREIRTSERNTLFNTLEWCAICGTPEELIQHDLSSINAIGEGGKTPLYYAALRGDINMVRALLQHGAVNRSTHVNLSYTFENPIRFFVTPLSIAVAKGHNECAWTILGDINEIWSEINTLTLRNQNSTQYHRPGFEPTPESYSFLVTIALLNKNIEFVRSLLADENFRPNSFRFNQIIELIIKLNTEKQDFSDLIRAGLRFIDNPLPILSYAAKVNCIEIAQLMLERGARPNELIVAPLSRTFEPSEILFPNISTAMTHTSSHVMKELLEEHGGVSQIDTTIKVEIFALSTFVAIALALTIDYKDRGSPDAIYLSASEVPIWNVFVNVIFVWGVLNIIYNTAIRQIPRFRSDLSSFNARLLGTLHHLTSQR